jgi:riboflavin kinase/FMN adenylyltransferase|tara:strand:+ start:156 stop:1103 length:948 start_codon:yes stop_codon:yes gene_type:complete
MHMQVFTDYRTLPDEIKGSTVVIGNFDGLHVGHRMLIELARKKSKEAESKLLILTFNPHPRRYFMPDAPPFLLTPGKQHEELLAHTQADYALYLGFDNELAHLTADEFMDHILKGALGAKQIVIGDDFCFGKGRTGNVDTLRTAGFHVTALSKMADNAGRRYSSSRIRDAISGGDMHKAEQIMGRPFEIRGKVIHGDKRGRELGYPTANIRLGTYIHPAYGVYACKVKIPGEDHWRIAATNIGIRPMFESPEALIEAYILGYDGDLYDQELRIRPLRKIRNEMKFESLEELIAQIRQDCGKVQDVINETDTAIKA